MRKVKSQVSLLALGMIFSMSSSFASDLNATNSTFNTGALELGSAAFWLKSNFASSLGSTIVNAVTIATPKIGDVDVVSSAKTAVETAPKDVEHKPWGKRRNHYLAQSAPDGTIPYGVDVPQPAEPEGDGRIQNVVPPAVNGKKSFALTLAGGGARGAAHIGVLRVLEREGLRPSFVSGSSIGAVIGSLYCAGVPVSEIEKLMLSGKVRKALMPVPIKLQAAWSMPRDLVLRMLQQKPQVGFYSGKSLSKFIRQQMPAGVNRMEDMKIPFAVIATNILDTRATWIASGDVGEAVRASASMPYIYKPCLIDGKALVDGGMRANLPTGAARASGAPVVVAVKLHSSLESKPCTDFRTMLQFSDRVMSIMMAEIESKNMNDADVLIEPNIDDFKLYSFEKDVLKRAIESGEKAAEKMIPQLRVALQPDPTKTAETASPAKLTH